MAIHSIKPFLTYFILCSSSFLLGIIYCNWAFDHAILWDRDGATSEALARAQSHYAALYHAPTVMRNTLYTAIAAGLGAMVLKLYKPDESNTLFDGGSLVLYMVAVVMLLTNVRTGLESATTGEYGDLTQKEGLSVVAASQVMVAIALIGVLILQGGQFYAERVELKRKQMVRQQERRERKHQ